MTIQEQADAILARPDADELTMRLASDRKALIAEIRQLTKTAEALAFLLKRAADLAEASR
jgi:hypothetical protein